MKTKTSLWFSFCTLVLCLGVMTFGVYSALSASLNMSGTLGFNMHNCIVSVEGTIYNMAEFLDSNTVKKVNKPIQRAIMGGENTTSANLDIGTLNFYRGAYTDGETITAKTYDIIFEIKFTNMHTKAISAIFPIPTVSNSNISIISGEDNNYTAFKSENSTYQTRILQNSSTTVKFALHLDDSSAVLSNVTLNWHNISFIEAPDLLYNYDKENDYYYLEMGVNPFNNNEPLRWISFAKYDENIQGFDFFDKSEEPVSGGTYYFISELVMYTEYDEEADIAYGVPYQNYYSMVDGYKVLGHDKNYLAQDYAVSTIRKYLNGGTVKNQGTDGLEGNMNGVSPYGKEVSIEPYQILTSKIYQDYIIPRDLSDLYEVGTHMQQEGIDLYDCGKEKDKLWILSNTKKTNDSNTECGWLDVNYLDYLCGNVTGKSFYGGEEYHSRTPSNMGYAYESMNGIANYYSNTYWGKNDINILYEWGVATSNGVRPCFQITMP